jgi:calcyclin binding protein
MDSRRFELEADIQEIDRLLALSTRNYIKELLFTQRVRLSEELKSIPISESPVVPVNETIVWKALDRFAWEQTDTEVKIYVTTLDGLKSHPRDKIVLENTNNSVTVSILGFNNANHKLSFNKLSKDIKSARITVKSNGFSLTLTKNDKGHWDAVVPKPSLIKKSKEEDKKDSDSKEPGDSLMNMMKELYENGDDDMKRTIAEAWSKSKDKPN